MSAWSSYLFGAHSASFHAECMDAETRSETPQSRLAFDGACLEGLRSMLMKSEQEIAQPACDAPWVTS
jgi:hypothetical protein